MVVGKSAFSFSSTPFFLLCTSIGLNLHLHSCCSHFFSAPSVSFSYNCDCEMTGFAGVHCEEDILECESDPCQHGATCLEGINHYSCLCWPGESWLMEWNQRHINRVCGYQRSARQKFHSSRASTRGCKQKTHCKRQTNKHVLILATITTTIMNTYTLVDITLER